VTDADYSPEERVRGRTATPRWAGRPAVAAWDDRTAFAQWDDESKRGLLEILSEEVWDIEEELARVKETRALLMTSLQGNVAHRAG
jgi:hypothetical protein